VGRVVEVGNSVANVRAGDIVWAMLPHASHAIVDGKRPYVIAPSDIDPQEGLFVALTSTAIHTLRRGNLELGDDVAVIGLGVLGLLIVQVAKAAGARRVIAINPSHWKLELARRLGADLTLTTQDANWQKTLLEATDGRGTDVSIDCSGTGEGVMAAIDAVRKRGRVLVAGFHTEPFAISGEDLFAKELAIFGVRSTGGPDYSYEYTRWNQNSNYQEAAHLLFTGRVRGCDLITHRIAATDAELAYRLIDRKSESFLQIVLDWTLKQ
jgi:2-desacetyl-2-hydroxyethyl bacteriochlorophyllide A dehydrogenase